VKRAFVTMPMLPRMSARGAAARLLDVLALVYDCVLHCYGSQVQPWHNHLRPRSSPAPRSAHLPQLDDQQF